MPFPNAPENPAARPRPPAGNSTTTPSEPAQTSPEPAGRNTAAALIWSGVPHPDFEAEATPGGGQATKGEPTPQAPATEPGGETPPDGAAASDPGQAQGQAAEPYMKLKHRGREIAVDSVDKARALARWAWTTRPKPTP